MTILGKRSLPEQNYRQRDQKACFPHVGGVNGLASPSDSRARPAARRCRIARRIPARVELRVTEL